MRHEAVARCAAFAVADQRLGEKVCLSVIWHDGESEAKGPGPTRCSPISPRRASRNTTCQNISSRWKPYPLTASGKILKRELVEWAKGRIAPAPVRWRGS